MMEDPGGTSEQDSNELEILKLALASEKKARAAERAGRVRAEKKLREYEVKLLTRGSVDEVVVGDEQEDAAADDDAYDAYIDEEGDHFRRTAHTTAGDACTTSSSSTLYPLNPLGTFESSFSRRNGTPRQPHLVPMARGRVRLHSQIPNAALEGIMEFSHVWLIYVFHANTDLQKSVGARTGGTGRDGKRTTALAKVRVPRLNGERRGVLATRSPHRPAPVGLSLAAVRAVDLEKGVLEVGGADLVDGTPVLDIKPYVPFCDAPPTSDAFAPDWVAVESSLPGGEPLKLASVTWAPGAREHVQNTWNARGGARKSLYDDADDLTLFVEQALSRDIRSAHQRHRFSPGTEEQNSEVHSAQKWEVILDGIAIRYDILAGGEVVIANYSE